MAVNASVSWRAAECNVSSEAQRAMRLRIAASSESPNSTSSTVECVPRSSITKKLPEGLAASSPGRGLPGACLSCRKRNAAHSLRSLSEVPESLRWVNSVAVFCFTITERGTAFAPMTRHRRTTWGLSSTETSTRSTGRPNSRLSSASALRIRAESEIDMQPSWHKSHRTARAEPLNSHVRVQNVNETQQRSPVTGRASQIPQPQGSGRSYSALRTSQSGAHYRQFGRYLGWRSVIPVVSAKELDYDG